MFLLFLLHPFSDFIAAADHDFSSPSCEELQAGLCVVLCYTPLSFCYDYTPRENAVLRRSMHFTCVCMDQPFTLLLADNHTCTHTCIYQLQKACVAKTPCVWSCVHCWTCRKAALALGCGTWDKTEAAGRHSACGWAKVHEIPLMGAASVLTCVLSPQLPDCAHSLPAAAICT